MRAACSAAASAMARSACATDSAGVDGYGRVASAPRTLVTGPASSPLRPCGTGAVRHVQRGEHAKGFHRLDEPRAALFERGDLVGPVDAVLLVHEHLAPVFDGDVARRAVLIAEERAAEKRSRAAVHHAPFTIGA